MTSRRIVLNTHSQTIRWSEINRIIMSKQCNRAIPQSLSIRNDGGIDGMHGCHWVVLCK